MKTFSSFVRFKENTSVDSASNQDDLLLQVIRLAWKRYPQEAKDFFAQLGSKDPDIKELLEKIENPSTEFSPGDGVQSDVEDDTDVVAPPAADSNPAGGMED